MEDSQSKPIVLYDGVCGLCNGLTKFLLKHDANDRLRYAALQSHFSRELLTRHSANPDDLDTVYVVVGYGEAGERLLERSTAILYLAGQLGGIWKLGKLGMWVPRPLRDAAYKLVAKNRYRLFGKYDVCMMPDPKYRDKFLD